MYITGSWLEFGRVIVEHKLTNYYAEFLDLVEYMKSTKIGLEFRTKNPDEAYLFCGTLANIHAHYGDNELSKQYALKALDMVEVTKSGYRYHPKFGLVELKEKDTIFYKSLLAITENPRRAQ
jgi:hypothetical protein